jgi:hypothetical protein
MYTHIYPNYTLGAFQSSEENYLGTVREVDDCAKFAGIRAEINDAYPANLHETSESLPHTEE